MPQEKFQYKQRKTESALQTEAPCALPHSGSGSAYTYKAMDTSRLTPPLERFGGDSSLQGGGCGRRPGLGSSSKGFSSMPFVLWSRSLVDIS